MSRDYSKKVGKECESWIHEEYTVPIILGRESNTFDNILTIRIFFDGIFGITPLILYSLSHRFRSVDSSRYVRLRVGSHHVFII